LVQKYISVCVFDILVWGQKKGTGMLHLTLFIVVALASPQSLVRNAAGYRAVVADRSVLLCILLGRC
jgi:hypothetical protein